MTIAVACCYFASATLNLPQSRAKSPRIETIIVKGGRPMTVHTLTRAFAVRGGVIAGRYTLLSTGSYGQFFSGQFAPGLGN